MLNPQCEHTTKQTVIIVFLCDTFLNFIADFFVLQQAVFRTIADRRVLNSDHDG